MEDIHHYGKLNEANQHWRKTSRKSIDINVHTYDELTNIGSVDAVIKSCETDSSPCYSMLYAIECVIQQIRWHGIPKEERAIIKKEFDEAVKMHVK